MRTARAGSPWLAQAVVALLASALFGFLLVRSGLLVALAPAALAAAAVGAVLIYERPSAVAGALVALLAVFPIARVVLGGAPLYLADVLIAVALLAIWRRRPQQPPWALVVWIYLLSWIPALIYQWATIGVIAESTYGFLRNALAVLVVFIGWWVGQRPEATRRLGIMLAGGTLATCGVAVLQVIPATAPAIRSLLLALAPGIVENSYRGYPERAFGLFQAATTLAGFLILAGLLLLGVAAVTRGRARAFVIGVLVLIVPALIATYSRQWVPAAALAALVTMAITPRAAGVAALSVAAAVGLAGVAFASGALDVSYFQERFEGQRGTAQNISARLGQPGEFLRVQSRAGARLVVGRGFAGTDVAQRGLVSSSTAEVFRQGLPTENSLLLEFFNHGLAAGLLLIGLLLHALRQAVRLVRRRGPEAGLATALAAAVVAIAVLAVSDQYFSEAMFMKALMWLTVGLVFGLATAAESGMRAPEARAAAAPPGSRPAPLR